jgi:sugar O-acyltransferase (sialic acid O-acetyltransferase NeuD family)
MRPFVIIGAGGHGREAMDIVRALGWERCALGFVDDGLPAGHQVDAHCPPVLGGIEVLETLDAEYIIAIGEPAARRRIDSIVTGYGRSAITLVHPDTSIGTRCLVGPGAIIAPGARITTGVTIGRHTHLNVNAGVSHDSRLGDFVIVGPNAHVSGNVTVGDGVWLGLGCCVNQGLKIGDCTVVGSGAVVTEDLAAHVTAVGVPARPVHGNGQ